MTAAKMNSKPKKIGLLWGLLAFAVTIAAGAWAILQSRSSTAGIGFLFLPLPACVSAFGGWLAQRFLGKSVPLLILGLALAAAPPLNLLRAGTLIIQKNSEGDRLAQESQKKLEGYRGEIRASLAQHKGAEGAALSQFFEAHRADREAILAGLESEFVELKWLEQFSTGQNMGYQLVVVRNKNTPPQLLEQIWQMAVQTAYPGYLAVDLARNPKTPANVLEQVAKEVNLLLPQAILAHPVLNCATLANLKAMLEKGYLDPQSQKSYLERVLERERAHSCLKP
jgi:hypothetical protein